MKYFTGIQIDFIKLFCCLNTHSVSTEWCRLCGNKSNATWRSCLLFKLCCSQASACFWIIGTHDFRPPYNLNPVHWSAWNFERTIIKVRSPNLPSLVETLLLGAARQSAHTWSVLLRLFLLIFSFSRAQVERLNRCRSEHGLTQGGAFQVSF